MATATQVVGKGHISEEITSYVETDDVKQWSQPPIEPDGQGGFFIHPQLMKSEELYPFQILTIPFAAYKYADGRVGIFGIPD